MSENAMLPPGSARKYLEFPAHFSDDELSDDMKRCMHSIMCERLKPGWETMNWTPIYSLDKVVGEKIIREAAQRPEMTVIAQSAGYWAIRTIAEQRQKLTKRAAAQKSTRRRRAHQTSRWVGEVVRSHNQTLNSEERRKIADEVIPTCTEQQPSNFDIEPTLVGRNAIETLEIYHVTGEAVAEVPDLDDAKDLHREIEREFVDKSVLSEGIEQSSDGESEHADREANVINPNPTSHRQSEQDETCSAVYSMIQGMSKESIKNLFTELLRAHASKVYKI